MRTTSVLCGLLIIGAAVAWAAPRAQQEEPLPAVTSTLIIEEGVICTGVTERIPQGAAEAFTPDVGKLYCFTKVSGAVEGMTLKHVWYRDDKLLHAQALRIGGSSWRTWSSKTIVPDMTGAWKVEIRDSDDNLIITLKFTIQ